ncbi:hypothetical protein J437_LFUL017475, partial [Ladona fulva]
MGRNAAPLLEANYLEVRPPLYISLKFKPSPSFREWHCAKERHRFSITSRKNQTGHMITEIELDKSATHLPEVWKANFKQSFTEKDGVQEYHLKGVISAKPPTPSDYELFPGVGYYKFHTDLANGFEDASSRCTKEGGHLAIVNSESEHQVLSTMYARFPESELKTEWAFVGFHDRFKEGEYVTIYGEPLNTTGFTRWSSAGQPDDYKGAEDCGSVHRNGGLNDIACNASIPFFCEYDIS